MPAWLIKTEPDTYSWDQMVADKKTVWDGVANNLALKYMRTIKKGDLCLFYHTGDEKRIMGFAEVISEPYPDPKQEDPKLVVFDIKAGKALKTPVTLPMIKTDPAFVGWDLLRIGRLSVVPTPDAMVKRIEALGK